MEVEGFEKVQNEYVFCSEQNCYGELLKMDEMLLEMVRILHKKWYGIYSGCVADVFKNKYKTYVEFILDEEFQDVSSIPDGFQREFLIRGSCKYLVIYKEYDKSISRILMKKQVNSDVSKLFEWANSLPPLKELKATQYRRSS